MPRKSVPDVTLSSEKVVYAVQVDDDTIVSVEADSAAEAVKKAKGKDK